MVFGIFFPPFQNSTHLKDELFISSQHRHSYWKPDKDNPWKEQPIHKANHCICGYRSSWKVTNWKLNTIYKLMLLKREIRSVYCGPYQFCLLPSVIKPTSIEGILWSYCKDDSAASDTTSLSWLQSVIYSHDERMVSFKVHFIITTCRGFIFVFMFCLYSWNFNVVGWIMGFEDG